MEKFADEMRARLREAAADRDRRESGGANHTPDPIKDPEPLPFLTASRLELSTRELSLDQAEAMANTVQFSDLLGPYTMYRKPVLFDFLLDEMKVCYPLCMLRAYLAKQFINTNDCRHASASSRHQAHTARMTGARHPGCCMCALRT